MEPECADPDISKVSHIFVSYRRADEPFAVDQLVERLRNVFGDAALFVDVAAISPGEQFPSRLEEEIASASVVLVVIGPRWNAGNRLADADDFVRLEIRHALSIGKHIIPVTLGSTQMPEPDELPEDIRTLSTTAAVPLRPGPDLQGDLDRIIAAIAPANPTVLTIRVKGPFSSLEMHHRVGRDRGGTDHIEKGRCVRALQHPPWTTHRCRERISRRDQQKRVLRLRADFGRAANPGRPLQLCRCVFQLCTHVAHIPILGVCVLSQAKGERLRLRSGRDSGDRHAAPRARHGSSRPKAMRREPRRRCSRPNSHPRVRVDTPAGTRERLRQNS